MLTRALQGIQGNKQFSRKTFPAWQHFDPTLKSRERCVDEGRSNPTPLPSTSSTNTNIEAHTGGTSLEAAQIDRFPIPVQNTPSIYVENHPFFKVCPTRTTLTAVGARSE